MAFTLVTRDVIRGVSRSVIASAGVSRAFMLFDDILQSYATIQTPIIEAGAFSHTYRCQLPASGAYIVADNTPITGVSGFSIHSGGGLYISGSSIVWENNIFTAVTAALGDGMFHEFGLRRDTSNNLTLSFDGVDLDTVVSGAVFTFNSIGSKNGTPTSIPFFDGYMLGVDFGNGNAWELSTATGNSEQAASGSNLLTFVNLPEALRSEFTLDDSVQPNRWVGDELVVNGGFDSATGWSTGPGWQVSGGASVYTEVGGNRLMYREVELSEIMRVTVDITSITGAIDVYNSGTYVQLANSTGVTSIDLPISNTSYAYLTVKAVLGSNIIVNSLSARQLIEVAP